MNLNKLFILGAIFLLFSNIATANSDENEGPRGFKQSNPKIVKLLKCSENTSSDSLKLSTGDKVLVEWEKQYWRAKIIGGTADDGYKVHYCGWDDKWDEDVSTSRILEYGADKCEDVNIDDIENC